MASTDRATRSRSLIGHDEEAALGEVDVERKGLPVVLTLDQRAEVAST